jgi:hypothetical protein
VGATDDGGRCSCAVSGVVRGRHALAGNNSNNQKLLPLWWRRIDNWRWQLVGFLRVQLSMLVGGLFDDKRVDDADQGGSSETLGRRVMIARHDISVTELIPSKKPPGRLTTINHVRHLHRDLMV